MTDALFMLLAGLVLGFTAGLWLGFKLWRQSYVKISPMPGRDSRYQG
jgi:hypothetical protein